MAARLKPHHQDDIRAKIQASVIVDMLTKLAVENKIRAEVRGTSWREATPDDAPLISVRVRAAMALLNKTLPDLTRTELNGAGGGPLIVEMVRFADTNPQ